MEHVRNNVSNFLKNYRKKHRLTQEELAEKLGYSTKMVANWEQCKNDMPMEVVLHFRKEMGCSIDEIFGLKFEKKYEDIDDMVFDICSEYACDDGNLHYSFFGADDIDRDDIFENARSWMYDFLDEMAEFTSNIKVNDKETFRVDFDNEITSKNEFLHLVRNKYIQVEYVLDEEKKPKARYVIAKKLYLYLYQQHFDKMRREIDSIIKEAKEDWLPEEMESLYKMLEQIMELKRDYEKHLTKLFNKEA